ncbi:cingulin-like protein 1 isoform X1 [Pantherophis guttatus]|uniref:Cingulin-like protein 1 isoform X1 n=1 Tax=Pantherophis guttatus TaxID=94885 RepID=A0A6P9B9L2_PANGU|nr:cingulin-like protein 1 isoform X1 [Pantherophis guttatus]XP_060545509.1 cingulin-like protein 1 isoform X1 [Pantherophis guttatus]XP_060545510.1 cingulin-like protein 1 isoform X1 [Pantherophis guttatus]XP_060545511.1 cingulin-like protein 1 isoform X1 [Pantherophis guttatus]
MKSSPNGFRQRDHVTPPKLARQESPKNPPNAKAGSYGVTIRVQGIDGHPYLVLNNNEGCLSANLLGPENSQQIAADQPAPDATLPAIELVKKSHEGRSFGGLWDNAPPSWIKSLNQASRAEGKETASPFKAEISQVSNLLNFQKYPELLQPYNPANSILTLKDLQPCLLSKSQSLEDEEKLDSKPWNSSLKVALGGSTSQFVELSKSKLKMVDLTKPDQNKQQQLESPSVADRPGGRLEWLTSGAGSSPAGSSSTCPGPRRCRPDLLPFRQPDSAGAALNGSQKSSSSSTTPTSAASVSRFFLDDQEYAIYADHVNRHENRRYIPFLPGTGRDIDTGSIPAVEELIEKFDRKVCPQRRGRLGFRTRTLPENQKRSKSVDSALSHGLYSDCIGEFTKSLGRSSEHLVQSSQVCLQKPLSPEKKATSLGEQLAPQAAGKLQTSSEMRESPSSHFSSLQHLRQDQMNPESLPSKSSTLPTQRKKRDHKTLASTLLLPESTMSQTHSRETFASGSKNAQVTPDLLKGQQELARQSNEETAKQILYNYLKEGTSENEDTTKRKVNLVFEKIQTLKSRAAGSPQTSDASVEVNMLVEEKKWLRKEVSELQRKLDLELKNQQNFKAERQTMETELQKLRQQLKENMEEKDTFRRQLKESEKDLRENLEELFQVKIEREQHQREIRDLQDQLSEMHDELDSTKHMEDSEKEQLVEELMQMKQGLQELLVLKDQQEKTLKKRERELAALKGVLKEEMASQDQEMGHLKEQHVRELQSLRDSLAKATEKIGSLSSAKAEAEKEQRSQEGRVAGMAEQNGQLRKALGQQEKQQQELQLELENLRGGQEEAEERLRRCMREMQSLTHAKEEACQLASAKVSLEAQLKDAQRNISRLRQEQQQLMGCLEDEASQKDQLQKTKRELENELRQLDRTVETLQKEMAEIIKVSQESTQQLQKQLDEYKEKNQQQLVDSQQRLKDKTLELEKAYQTILKMQEQVRFMEEELQGHKKAQKEALTKTRLLEDTVKNLEYELETKSHLKEDRARQAKILEDKISQLELELEEERSNSDILSGRIDRGREQIEQMRSELLQERTTRQELEGDKTALERQNKELRGRILHLEGSPKPSKEGLLAQMEAHLLALEEQLESEERDRAHLQLTNRRLERTVKELLMQVDDEHLSLTDQKDQLSLRLKAMKRQVEEAEEEIDRLENTKKKLQRDLEDQVDLNDQLQGQLTTIRQDLRRQKTSNKLLSDFDYEDDDFSTDGESLFDAPLGLKSFKRSDGKAKEDASQP